VDFISGTAENIEGERADAAGRAGHGQGAVRGGLPVVFHPEKRKRGGKTGGADAHGIAQGQAGWQRNHPLRFQPRILRIAAIAGFTQP